MANLYQLKHFCIKLIFGQENDIFIIKILEMPVKDRTKRRPMRPTQEDEEEVMIPILKVVLIAGHLRQNQDI